MSLREFGLVRTGKVTYTKFSNAGYQTVIGKSVIEMKQKFYVNVYNNNKGFPTP